MMWNRRRIGAPLALLAVAVLIAGCNDETDPELSLLNANRAKWQAANIDSYVFVRSRSCFCIVEEPIVITVTNGVITDAFFTPSGVMVEPARMASLRTIDDFFDIVADAIERDFFKLEVTYDETYGFPTYIFTDEAYLLADEEISYTIRDFQ